MKQLKQFSFPKTVREQLGQITVTQKQFSDILVWMLRRDVLLQLYTYLMLIIPESFDMENAASGKSVALTAAAAANAPSAPVAASAEAGRANSSSLVANNDDAVADEDMFPAAKTKLSPYELAFVNSIAAEKTALDLLFLRLCYYGRGRHHLDEIVWRENITHQDIENVLQNPKYSCLLRVQLE